MTLGPVRPRFRLILPGDPAAHLARVLEWTRRDDCGCTSTTTGLHVSITVREDARHTWSPTLHLEFRYEQGETIVDGLLGPSPHIWTMFAFSAITVLIVIAFGAMIGAAQLTIGHAPWAFWSVPAGIAVLVLMYIVSQTGQRLGAEQMRHLRAVVDDALGGSATSKRVNATG